MKVWGLYSLYEPDYYATWTLYKLFESKRVAEQTLEIMQKLTKVVETIEHERPKYTFTDLKEKTEWGNFATTFLNSIPHCYETSRGTLWEIREIDVDSINEAETALLAQFTAFLEDMRVKGISNKHA